MTEVGLPATTDGWHPNGISSAALANFHVKTGITRGRVTKKVYDLITRKHISRATGVLTELLTIADRDLNTRLFSLLGYCHYERKNYPEAGRCFETLWTSGRSEEAQTDALAFAHCLAKQGLHHEAFRVLNFLGNIQSTQQTDTEGMAVALHVQVGNFAEAKKHFALCQAEDLSQDYNYAQYLYRRKEYSGAAQIYRNLTECAEDTAGDLGYAEAACLYHLEDHTGTATQAAGLYDAIVEQYPALVPTYDDDRTMIRPEAAGNIGASYQIAAVLVLQAGCYFQQGRPRTARGQLNLIPSGLDPSITDKIDLVSAVLDQDVDAPACIGSLERLATESSVQSAAERELLVMYLREGHYVEAGQLVDSQEESLRKTFEEVEWTLTEAALIASIDTLSAGRIYSQVITDLEQDIEHLQEALKKLLNGDDHSNGGNDRHRKKIEKKEAQLSVTRKSLRLAVVGLAKLYHDKENYQESVKCLQKHVDHCQDDLIYCTALAHCLFMAKNYTEASFIYETIIKYYKDTQFTLASVPVPVLSRYCAAQLFANADEGLAKETLAEILRSEKVNFEDAESEYHMVAAKRTHIVSTCLLIAATYLENGSFLEAFRKAKEALRLHPWHLTQENNIKNSQNTWTALKTLFLVGLRRFAGLLTEESTKITVLLPDIIADLADLEQFTTEVPARDVPARMSPTKKTKLSIADEARQLRQVCQMYYDQKGGRSSPADSFNAQTKLRLPLVKLQELRRLVGLLPA